MKAIIIFLALAMTACATAPQIAPAQAEAKRVAQHAIALDAEYVNTLKDALVLMRTKGTDPRVIQGVQNATTDCARAFDQLEKATAAALQAPPETAAVIAGNVNDWSRRAENALKNLHAMMRERY